jgi:hypothetical protein
MAFTIIEFSTLILAILIAFVLYVIIREGTQLAMNAVLGILTLLATKFLLGLKITITLLTVIICAFGGIFGAILLIILNYFRIGFI